MNDLSQSLVAPRLAKYFTDYEDCHRTVGIKVSHYVGIPMIVIGLFGLLGRCLVGDGLTGSEYFRLDGGTILLALGYLWYLYLDWKIATPFVLSMCGLYFLGRSMPVPLNVGLFVLGWVFQGIGHVVYEKKSPAFAKNLMHLLTGPLWIFAKVVGYL